MIGDTPMPGRDAGSEAGFTLVELLVALALFSLLATLLFGNVRFGLHAWQKASVSTERFQRSMISRDLLRRMIGNLYPMLVPGDPTQPQIDFDGGKEAVNFLGYAPTVASGGRFRFRVFIERRRDQADLVMSSTPELADSDSPMTAKTLLLSGIERVEFSYFGDSASGQHSQWNDSWIKRSEIPSLVRIRVTTRSDEAQFWPDLIIAPRILADVGCVYDPITMRCRGR